MKAVDSNVLIYAHHAKNEHFDQARASLRDLAVGPVPWALPWPCVYEFLRVVTHPSATEAPLGILQAWAQGQTLLNSPNVILLTETERHAEVLEGLIRRVRVTGNLVHDAHIAALLIEHGVREILTADDDFRKFEALTVTNPFV